MKGEAAPPQACFHLHPLFSQYAGTRRVESACLGTHSCFLSRLYRRRVRKHLFFCTLAVQLLEGSFKCHSSRLRRRSRHAVCVFFLLFDPSLLNVGYLPSPPPQLVSETCKVNVTQMKNCLCGDEMKVE